MPLEVLSKPTIVFGVQGTGKTSLLNIVLTSLARRQYLAFKNELRDAPALPD